mmetsp:Transcript_28074/g.74527  ORF Transcript_28074/g.74527 Transcript_28074/m.74527 type:complete len:97 (-) Transcript_28074:62-352(-)
MLVPALSSSRGGGSHSGIGDGSGSSNICKCCSCLVEGHAAMGVIFKKGVRLQNCFALSRLSRASALYRFAAAFVCGAGKSICSCVDGKRDRNRNGA